MSEPSQKIEYPKYEDGIYSDITIEDYHHSKGISATTIKWARESLKHYDWYRRGLITVEKKPHYDFGNAFELALLAHEEYLKKVAVIPDSEWIEVVMQDDPKIVSPRGTKLYKKLSEEWHAQQDGKYLIQETGKESFETIEEMLSSCYQDKVIQALIKNTEYQLSLYWTDPDTGIQLKTRPDFCKRKKNVIVNLKTTEDGSPEGFARDIGKFNYGLQAAIETRGAVATGLMETVDTYLWLVVEKVPPFNASLYEFDKVDAQFFDDELSFLLGKIKKAKDEKFYPGYSDFADNEHGILTAKIPLWAKRLR